MLKRILIIWIAAFFAVWPATLSAQQQPGRMKGRVVDASGNPAANIDVTVRSVDTGTENTVQTDAQGSFVIAELQPGKYLVQTGSSQTTAPPAQSKVDPACTTDLSLQTTATGQIAVMAEVVTQPEGTASIDTTFSERPIELLPQPNATSRDGDYFGAYNLALLSEGVTPGFLFQRGVGPSVAGRPNTTNNFLVDGTDNNAQVVPGPLVRPSNEVTTEFALMQNEHSPMIGQSTGGKFNTVLAQGTNAWHGGAYDYLNNRKLMASDPGFGDNRDDMRFDQNRMGGKIGGPFMTDKLFGFFGLEYTPTRFERRLFGTTLAPTPAGFAALAANPNVSTNNLLVLRNNVLVSTTPVSFTTVAGTVVPLGIVSTGVKNSTNFWNGIAAMDWNMGGRSNLGFRYVHNDTGSDVFASSLPAFGVPGHTRALLGAINYSRIVGTATAININAGYNRLDRSTGASNFFFPGQDTFPNIGIESLGLTLGPNIETGKAIANTYQLSAQADWTASGHHLTFGGDFRDLINTISNTSDTAGRFTFSSVERFLLDLPPDVVARRSFGSTAFNGNRWLLYAFGQDSFRLNKAVNIEFGLGYQYATIPASLKRQSALAGLSVPGLITFAEPENEKLNLAPRFGIAWAPGAGHTIIRGSFGMMYDALSGWSSFQSPEMTFGTVTSAEASIPGFFARGGIRRPVTAVNSVGAFAFEQKLPYILQWNVAASHEFWGRLATEIKYMGNHGVHQPLLSLVNDPLRVIAGASLPVFFGNPGQAALDGLTLTQEGLAARTDRFIAAGFTNPIFGVRPDGTSWYNAAAFKVSERFTAGTQVAAQYTYSDARTEATATPLDLIFGRRMEQAPWNVKHRVTVTPILDVAAMLPRTTGWVHSILADLSLMGTWTYASKQRVPILGGLDTGMNGIGFGSGVFVNPGSTSGIASGVVPLRNSAGSTVAFLATNPNAQFVVGAPGTFSNARPTIQLDDTRNIDLALVKRFSFPDRAKIEIRGDGYNLFNRHQATGLPISTLGTGLGFAPTSNFVLLSNPQFQDIRGSLSGNPRTFQLALRVIF